MKKLLFVLCTLALFGVVNAQSLEEIISKQSAALWEEKFDKVTSLKTTGTISQMGMEMQSTIWFKAPNKIKIVVSFNGQEIIQTFDGEEGYMINPMTGSTDPQPLPASQTESMKSNSSLKSPLSRYLKEGKLSLEGSEDLEGKPAFKIKVNDGTNVYYMFVDKATSLPVKMTMSVSGTDIEVFQTYAELGGLMLPKSTVTKAGGMEMSMTIDSAEINIPVEDSFFKVK